MPRKYHVVAINSRTGRKVFMTKTPVTHKEGCTMLSKISRHPARRVQLEDLRGRKARYCPLR